MINTLREIQGHESVKIPGYPDAPIDWTPAAMRKMSDDEQLELTANHLDVIRALQHFFVEHDAVEDGHVNLRELHDALDERFHHLGGMKYLYQLFPGGPVAQGCRLAGLKAPYIATDYSFGSVA